MTRPLVAPPVAPGRLHAEEPDATRANTLELLSWLLRFPLLCINELAALMELSASATAAHLAQACAYGYVRSVPASLLGRHVARLHALTPLGLTALAERDGTVVWERARHFQADTPGLLQLLADLPAVLATQAFVLALIGRAEEALCRQPAQCITWSWSRHVCLLSLATESDQRTGHHSLRGDASARLTLQSADQDTAVSYWLMIRWDSGLLRAADVRRELLSVLRIRDSYERHGQFAAFPRLLVLAPNARHAALWQAQALRLATERWLTHPLLGGALALDDRAPLLPFPPATVNSIDPWRAAWRSFAQPGTQTLSDILQASHHVGARPSAQSQMSRRTGSMHDAVEVARFVMRLDACSLRMLTALYLYPLLSTQQLAVVLDVKPTSAERMSRRLRSLDLAQIQIWSDVQHSALSDRGTLLLARYAHLPGGMYAVQANSHPSRVLRGYQRDVRSLARTPEHTEGVYSFFTALLQACAAECEQGYDATLLWWETGARCARAFHDAGGWRTIRPDGAGEWRVEGQRFSFWLEWDRGTMGPRDLTAKFAAYARYLQSGEWRINGDDPLPALLIVTSDIPQEARLLDALTAALPNTRGLAVYLTQCDDLATHGPFARIWRRYERRLGRAQWSIPSSLLSDFPTPQVSADLYPPSQTVRYTAGQGPCSARADCVGCGCGTQAFPERHGRGRLPNA